MPDFREQLEIGRKSERAVAFLGELKNYLLLPLTDINNLVLANGGAPRAFDGFGSAIILPDLLAVRLGRIHPLEVKNKSKPTFHRKTRTLEHGVDLRNYQHYCAFSCASNTNVILVIDEGSTGEILAGSLERLGEPRVYYGETGRPPMAYWPRNKFTTFHQGEPTDLPLFCGQAVAPTLRRSQDLGGV